MELEDTRDPNDNDMCEDEDFIECTNDFMKEWFTRWPGCVPPFLSSNPEHHCNGIYNRPDQNTSNVRINHKENIEWKS